ncbi:hypothetical protein HMPREF1032_03827 [Subdoligranulum sp. 4_3_54A2FAA]|nr:hypothetical protein HMPREF1032_03827 [Subdoligranulum sp. 4_3_54A2FAA]
MKGIKKCVFHCITLNKQNNKSQQFPREMDCSRKKRQK